MSAKTGGKGPENIRVHVRMRPFTEKEKSLHVDLDPIWQIEGSNQLADCSNNKNYFFDRVYDEYTSNERIFTEVAEPMIWDLMEGINGSIFCYGQTGSGKTFTMQGNIKKLPGIIPKAIDTVFSYIEETPERQYLLRISYLEIYNECLNDLLNRKTTQLKIVEDKKKGLIVPGLTEEVCSSIEQVYSLLQLGTANRTVGATHANEKSSRSHTIFRMTVESATRGGLPEGGEAATTTVSKKGKKPGTNVATINLIDLAGSESANVHTPGNDKRAREMKFINKSLLTLATVIQRLADSKSRDWIPYRDSKLTRLLQPSLEGKSKVSIICNIAPTKICYDETVSTLKFAQRAKKIKQEYKADIVDETTLLIKKYEDEISKLTEKLKETERRLQDEVERRSDIDLNASNVSTSSTPLGVVYEKLERQMELTTEEKNEILRELETLRGRILIAGGIHYEDIDEEVFNEVNHEFDATGAKTDSRLRGRSMRLKSFRESVAGGSTMEGLLGDFEINNGTNSFVEQLNRLNKINQMDEQVEDGSKNRVRKRTKHLRSFREGDFEEYNTGSVDPSKNRLQKAQSVNIAVIPEERRISMDTDFNISSIRHKGNDDLHHSIQQSKDPDDGDESSEDSFDRVIDERRRTKSRNRASPSHDWKDLIDSPRPNGTSSATLLQIPGSEGSSSKGISESASTSNLRLEMKSKDTIIEKLKSELKEKAKEAQKWQEEKESVDHLREEDHRTHDEEIKIRDYEIEKLKLLNTKSNASPSDNKEFQKLLLENEQLKKEMEEMQTQLMIKRSELEYAVEELSYYQKEYDNIGKIPAGKSKKKSILIEQKDRSVIIEEAHRNRDALIVHSK